MLDLSRAEALKPTIRDASRSGNLALYHEAQSRGLTLTELLEEYDPSTRNEAGKIDSPLDAFERQLAVNDLAISGRNAATVEQFLMSDAALLAPEFILREIRYGMTLIQDPADLVAVQVPEKGPSTKPVYFKTTDVKKSVARQGQGAGFPTVTVNYREKEAVMVDRGRQFDFPYRVIRHQRLTEFRALLWAIGAQMAADELKEIYNTLRNGDGTSSAPSNSFAGTAGTLAYGDLVHVALDFGAPARMTHLLAAKSDVEKILNMTQFQDPAIWQGSQLIAKAGIHATIQPLNSKLTLVEGATATELIAIDSRFALRESVAQPLTVEAEKVISAKLETAVVSKESVYTILLDDAVKLCDY
ncbi:MAG: hypothetical protein OEM52_10475 [bacterium]|nr:hypothetical protein [bacterium]